MGQLSDAERLDWLRLIRTDRIGPRTFRALVQRFGGAAPALDALPDLARQAGRSRIRIPSRQDAERELDAAMRLGARLIALCEPDYPRPLLAIEGAPPLVLVRGLPAILHRPAVAIVGSRNASAAGGAFAERLAAELGEAGYAVVSGLARGIDTRAHRAAITAGTVAVLAGGHDRVYPAENVDLLERIVAKVEPRCPKCRSAGSRVVATSPGETGSCRDSPTASSSSRPRAGRVR
jgi:DNA processing protein